MIQSTTGRYYAELSNQPEIAQLQQLTQLTWDGDLIGKEEARKLAELGFVERRNGWNLITWEGIAKLQSLGFINP